MLLIDDLVNAEGLVEDKLLDSHIHLDNLSLKLSEQIEKEFLSSSELNLEQKLRLNAVLLELYRLILEYGFSYKIERLFNMNLLCQPIIPAVNNYFEVVKSMVETSAVFVSREILTDNFEGITNFYGVHPITISRGYLPTTEIEQEFVQGNSKIIERYADKSFKDTEVFNLGEIGLDVNYQEFPLEQQIPLFKSQITSYLKHILSLRNEQDKILNISCHNVGCGLEAVKSLLEVIAELTSANSLPSIRDSSQQCELQINCILHAYNEQKAITNEIIRLMSDTSLYERFNAINWVNFDLKLYFGLSNHFVKGRLDQSYREVFKSERFKQGKLGFCFETDWPYMNQPEFRALTSKVLDLLTCYLSTHNLNLVQFLTEPNSVSFINEIKNKLISKEVVFGFEHPVIKQYQRLIDLFKRFYR